jgi:hypothetical protein
MNENARPLLWFFLFVQSFAVVVDLIFGERGSYLWFVLRIVQIIFLIILGWVLIKRVPLGKE